ncbi:MAG: hypothetical protein HQM10_14775 [Candidatus Riflebacteria bacterium]|nr:hypothetical protein [Candidatus Riflebacteria bacterium]
MEKSYGKIFYGYVEQAVCGGFDPLSPAISISRNGSLSKWRGNFHSLDLRVNDPGLRSYYQEVKTTLEKAAGLEIETNITLPEFFHLVVDSPPPPPNQEQHAPPNPGSLRPDGTSRIKKEPEVVRERVSCFFSTLNAIPSSVQGTILQKPPADFSDSELIELVKAAPGGILWYKLSQNDILPIIDLAIESKVKRLIVPVSEPGLYLDNHSEDEFLSMLNFVKKRLHGKDVELCIKNGGLSSDFFKKLHNETGCKLVYNIGTAFIERQDFQEFYTVNRDKISALILQQLVPGVNKFRQWRNAYLRNFQSYLPEVQNYAKAAAKGDEAERVIAVKLLLNSYFKYVDSRKNEFFNHGLFQNGDINLVPFLKLLKSDLRNSKDLCLIIESVPNLKNTQFLDRILTGESSPFM